MTRTIAALVTATCILGAAERARGDEAEDKAAQFVERLKGKVERDDTKPGKPVVTVDLSHKKVTDARVKELVPDNPHLHRWLDMARERIAFQGLPARICWLGLKDRARVGLAFNEMVARGELKAPVVIGRDHLDSGSVASPNRETEGMRDGSDAVSDWPLLNALLNTASGATWVSFHHGGGVGIGYSQHAGSRRSRWCRTGRRSGPTASGLDPVGGSACGNV